MSINRGIWQKALRWNKRVFAAAFFFLLSWALVFCAGAQDINLPKRALLSKGPFNIIGIDVLASNALAASRVFYTVDGIPVQVLGARGTIFYTGKPVYCQTATVIELDTAGEIAFGLEAAAGLHFFFIFPREYKDPCGFINGFVKRFEFFRNSSSDQKDIPFPAVFEI
ncbi:MAG: hypothetical protein EHM28_08590 [Spirochaetaceae bacterium]|nr:MAG: hypothetical protein EHM28_08590 [Spirochaetaceae bacterium]